MIVSVSFTFECESMEEAQDIVATWEVTPGVTMLGMQGTTVGAVKPAVMLMGGAIGPAPFAERAQMPPPVTPAPGGPFAGQERTE